MKPRIAPAGAGTPPGQDPLEHPALTSCDGRLLWVNRRCCELRFRRPDGRALWLRLAGVPLCDSHGERQGLSLALDELGEPGLGHDALTGLPMEQEQFLRHLARPARAGALGGDGGRDLLLVDDDVGVLAALDRALRRHELAKENERLQRLVAAGTDGSRSA